MYRQMLKAVPFAFSMRFANIGFNLPDLGFSKWNSVGKKNVQCQLQWSNIVSEAHGKLLDKPPVLTSYRLRIGPRINAPLSATVFDMQPFCPNLTCESGELQHTAHQILAGVALRSRIHMGICSRVVNLSIRKGQRCMGMV